MTNFVQKLNFSNNEFNGSMEIRKWHSVNYYDTLSLYCADNYVDLSDVPENEFDSAVDLMSEFGQADKATNSYFFSIDAN